LTSGGFRIVSDTLVLSRVSTALLTRDIDIGILSVRPSVRPSVGLSRFGIVSKRLNVSLYLLQHGQTDTHYDIGRACIASRGKKTKWYVL